MEKINNDQKLIKQLQNLKEVEPVNDKFYANLKTRLVNQRKLEMAVDDNFVATEKSTPRFSGFNFIMGGLSVAALASIIVVVVVAFSPTYFISNNTVAQLEDKPDFVKETKIDINGNVVQANEYELDGYWLNVTLPTNWEMENKNFDKDKLDKVVFTNKTAGKIVVTNNIEEDYKFIAQNNSLEDFAGFNLVKFTLTQLKNQSSRLDVLTNVVNQLFENNYLYRIPQTSNYIIFSTKSDFDSKLISAIVADIEAVDPYDNWNVYADQAYTGVSFAYPGSYELAKKDDYSYSISKSFVTDNYFKNITKINVDLSLYKSTKNLSEQKYLNGIAFNTNQKVSSILDINELNLETENGNVNFKLDITLKSDCDKSCIFKEDQEKIIQLEKELGLIYSSIKFEPVKTEGWGQVDSLNKRFRLLLPAGFDKTTSNNSLKVINLDQINFVYKDFDYSIYLYQNSKLAELNTNIVEEGFVKFNEVKLDSINYEIYKSSEDILYLTKLNDKIVILVTNLQNNNRLFVESLLTNVNIK